MPYSTLADLYVHGLPPGSLVPSSRVVSADSSTSTLMLDGHGFSDGDQIDRLDNQGGALPAGLSGSVPYFIKRVSSSLFQLTLTSGGSAVVFTDSGTGATSIVASLDVAIAKAIGAADDEIDDSLVAHSVPLAAPIPPIVTQWSAKLAAATIITSLGLANQHWKDSASAILDEARRVRAELARYRGGIPLRGTVNDQTPLVAESAAIAFGDCDRRWTSRDDAGEAVIP